MNDVVVVGSGLAGLATALALAEKNCAVTLVTWGRMGEAGSSALAQGGIAASCGPDDMVALHVADTLAAGAGLSDERAVETICAAGPETVAWLQQKGVLFDRDVNGQLKLGLEGAHSRRRIVHAHGDGTGASIVAALAQRIAATPSIKILQNCEVVRLAVERDANGKPCAVTGLWLLHHSTQLGMQPQEQTVPLSARPARKHDGAEMLPEFAGVSDAENMIFMAAENIVLATGGIGGLWQYTTNPLQSVGKGLALAARAGCVLRDLEFVQFHPTAIDISLGHAQKSNVQSNGDLNIDYPTLPLATEALRGEGARLCNEVGNYFMASHAQKDLAPRDIVARAIWAQLEAGHKVFLDARAIPAFAVAFPAVAAFCQAIGCDPAQQLIPVRPATHYHMGGIRTDLDGRTSLAGLWACGEVAATGLHGANRLASNSLLEAVVMGRRVAVAIGRLAQGAKETGNVKARADGQGEEMTLPPNTPALEESRKIVQKVRELMTKFVGVIRQKEGLLAAIAELRPLAQNSDEALVGLMIAQAALNRQESLGAHMRQDKKREEMVLQEKSPAHQDIVLEDVQ